MSANITDTLKAYGPIGVEVLRNAISQIEATGRTAQSIRYEVTSTDNMDQLMLIGRAFFELIEKGIAPSGKNPSPAMIEFLTEYARARGMSNPESAAWGIAISQMKGVKGKHKGGDETYRAGGRLVYSPELIKFVEELKTVITKQVSKGFLTEVVGAFKSGNNNIRTS